MTTHKHVDQETLKFARSLEWNCICSEQLEIRFFGERSGITHTSCGNCGESWWLTWSAGTLNHGTTEDALAALRGATASIEEI